jgi:hypothetical protein
VAGSNKHKCRVAAFSIFREPALGGLMGYNFAENVWLDA